MTPFSGPRETLDPWISLDPRLVAAATDSCGAQQQQRRTWRGPACQGRLAGPEPDLGLRRVAPVIGQRPRMHEQKNSKVESFERINSIRLANGNVD